MCLLTGIACHRDSTVAGELAADRDAFDPLRVCVPEDSIAGAPKLRAMRIIEDLELRRQGLNCGSIGGIGLGGNLDATVAIRTLAYIRGHVCCWARGGTAHSSYADGAYRETFDKASVMPSLLQDQGAAGVGG